MTPTLKCSPVVPGASPVPSSELGPADRDRFGETGNVQTATGRPAASRRREELVAGFVLRVQQKAPGTRTMGHRTLRFRVSVRFAYWAIRSECSDRTLNDNYARTGGRDEIKNAFSRPRPLSSLLPGPAAGPSRAPIIFKIPVDEFFVVAYFSTICFIATPVRCGFNDQTNSSVFVFISFRLDFYSVENGRWSGSTMGEWTTCV